MKRIIILGVVIAIVVIGWSAGWWYLAGQAREAVLGLAAGDGTDTPKLTCGTLGVGGWPFQINLDCTEPVVISGDTSISFDELEAAAVVYDPTHALVYARGPATISDAFTGSRQQLAWDHLEASVRLIGWRIGRISVIADKLALTDALMGDTVLAQADHAEFHLIDLPDAHDAARHVAGVRNYIAVKALALPGLGVSGAQGSFDASITGLPDDIRTWDGPQALKFFQQAGGSATINALKLDDGKDFLDATGKLALDARGRPSGQVTVNAKGLVERLGSTIPQDLRPILIGSPAPDGSYQRTLTLSNGVLLAGIVPIAALPSLF